MPKSHAFTSLKEGSNQLLKKNNQFVEVKLTKLADYKFAMFFFNYKNLKTKKRIIKITNGFFGFSQHPQTLSWWDFKV